MSRQTAISKGLLNAAEKLCEELAELKFAAPTSYVYNPLVYARRANELYVRRFASTKKRCVMMGMNPGPWGMAQTGIPFGEIAAVRDWMEIDEPVRKPPEEHPKRPILGLDCPRSEVSGARLWGLARERFASPEAFFERFFVVNYCPLVFLEEGGRNRTPDKLPKAEREALMAPCNRALAATIRALKPRLVIGVGVYAKARAETVLADAIAAGDLEVASILHPSPASPKANRGWAAQAIAELEAIGVELP